MVFSDTADSDLEFVNVLVSNANGELVEEVSYASTLGLKSI